jgi:hypothetical protein
MKARHKASGGRTYYSGGDSKVAKEAKETEQPMKRGGAVKHMDEAQDKKLVKKEIGKAMGEKGKKRMDRRAAGGRIGSDRSPMAPGSATHPYSSAAKK